ncbi:MAG: hypothetical protein EBR48_06270 [bacterium]|nr:hypothetical protein [Candidatus Aquidulcis frankliniae]
MELRRAVVDGVRIQMISGTHVLLLRDAEEPRYLPIPIGPNEASAHPRAPTYTRLRPSGHSRARRDVARGAHHRDSRRNISCADADGCPKRRRGGA